MGRRAACAYIERKRCAKLDPFAVGAGRQKVEYAVDDLDQVEIHLLQLEPVGLDLGEIQYVVEDRNQQIARIDDGSHLIPLFGVELGVQREADHAATTPFIGVRISWLIRARNSDFARTACSAFSTAAR